MAIQQSYGSSGQSISINLTSLADGSLRQSDSVDNSTNKFVGAHLGGSITTAGSGTSSTGSVKIYVAGSSDGGTTFSGGASGADSAYSGETDNLHLLRTITADTDSTTYEFDGIPVEFAFGDRLPSTWAVIVENNTGAALASGSLHYQGGEFESA